MWKRGRFARKRHDQDEQAHNDRAADLLGLDLSELVTPNDPQVGWMVRGADLDSIKGTGHICIDCSPTQPTGLVPVMRQQLAATMACTRCGRRLEGTRP